MLFTSTISKGFPTLLYSGFLNKLFFLEVIMAFCRDLDFCFILSSIYFLLCENFHCSLYPIQQPSLISPFCESLQCGKQELHRLYFVSLHSPIFYVSLNFSFFLIFLYITIFISMINLQGPRTTFRTLIWVSPVNNKVILTVDLFLT